MQIYAAKSIRNMHTYAAKRRCNMQTYAVNSRYYIDAFVNRYILKNSQSV